MINWARSSVREIDLAPAAGPSRRGSKRTLPKHVEPRLVALRDPEVAEFGAENLAELQRRIRDPNWRIFAEGGLDPCAQQSRTCCATPTRSCSSSGWASPTPSHAFYLGYEMMKAKTALTLSKTYRQDQALEWGFLTEPEVSHLARRGTPARRRGPSRRGPSRAGTGSGRTASAGTARDSRRDRDNAEPRRTS